MTVAWTPAPEDGARFLARHARRATSSLTIGAGDVDDAVAGLLAELG
jgi:hypothetical protein